MSSSIPWWQILTAHAQPFRGARDLAFCLKVPLDSLLVWASSGGSGETARMRRLAWTFAARIGDKYQIRLTRSIFIWVRLWESLMDWKFPYEGNCLASMMPSGGIFNLNRMKTKDHKQCLLDIPGTVMVNKENYCREYKGYTNWLSLISSHFAKNVCFVFFFAWNFFMHMLIISVCAKYQKASVKALVQVDFLMYVCTFWAQA